MDWYSLNKILTYNAYLNFILGGRGIGKTFSVKKYLLSKAYFENKQFIYLRRTQTELMEIDKDSFFTPELLEQVFDNYEMLEIETVKNSTKITFNCLENGETKTHTIFISSKKITIDNRIMCYFKSLSTWVKLKGSEYPDVWYIMFDEVLIDTASRNTYLPNEVNAFIQLISSVFRHRSNRKIFLLSNATNYNNPYFNYFEFYGDNSKEFWNLKKFGVVIQFCRNRIISEENTSDIFKLSRNASNFDSNVNNEFQVKFNGNIGKMGGKKIPLYCIYDAGSIVTVFWTDGALYVKAGANKDCEIFTFNLDDMESGYQYLPRTSEIIKRLRNKYFRNDVFYEDIKAKTMFNNAIRKFL